PYTRRSAPGATLFPYTTLFRSEQAMSGTPPYIPQLNKQQTVPLLIPRLGQIQLGYGVFHLHLYKISQSDQLLDNPVVRLTMFHHAQVQFSPVHQASVRKMQLLLPLPRKEDLVRPSFVSMQLLPFPTFHHYQYT